MIKIGEFYLNQDSSILYDAQHQEVSVESKTMQVLVYLLKHNERYITLSELHNNLWEGRIVSDSAVRQTISKLRKLLNDNGDNSKIIRSVVKKGYRFIYPVEINESYIDDEPKLEQHAESYSKPTHYRLIKTWGMRFCIITAILSILIFGGLSITVPLGLAVGVNTGISFNSEGEAIYVAKSQSDGTYKLMKQSGNNSVVLMKSKNALLFPLVTDSQEIWVGWQSIDKCGIYNISTTGNITQPIALLNDTCITISHLSVQGNNILISSKANAEQPFKISIINTDDLSISDISLFSQIHDPLMAALSPSKKWLAAVSQKSQQYVLSIYNRSSGQRLGQWNFDNAATQLRWHKNKIYISTTHSLDYIELKTLEKKQVLTSDSTSRLVDFWINDETNLILQEQQTITNQSHLANYHNSEKDMLTFYQSFYLESDLLSFSGDTPQTVYYSHMHHGSYQIVQLTNTDVIYSSDLVLNVLNYERKEHSLLFTEGNDLVLLSLKTLKVLSRVNIQSPIKGVFKHPEKPIYWLTTKSKLGWQTLNWDYSTHILTQIAVNELARFMVGNNVVWLDARDRKIKINIDKTITTISESIPIYDHSQWVFSQGNLWFSQKTPVGSTLFKVGEKSNWIPKKIFKTDSIEHISIGQKNVYVQTKKFNTRELFDVTHISFSN